MTFANRPHIGLKAVRDFVHRHAWAGYVVALAAVGCALAARAGLERLGSFYYLPFVPAVLATAIVSGRRETGLALLLAITANVVLVQRDDLVDTTTNALLFAAISWPLAELCWRLKASQMRAGDLSLILTRRETMLDTLLASVPVVTLDCAGHVRLLTPTACRLLGTSEAVALGQPFNRFVEAFDLDTFPVDPAREGDCPDRFWLATRGDGRRIPIAIQLGLLPHETGGDHATLCLTDLTQAHAADARAHDLHTQLNRIWRLNSLGEMAATLAHELNQPLTAAATYLHASQTDLKRAGLIGQSASQTIELAKNQLLRAGEIIRRMRELLAYETRSLGVERVAAMVADLAGVFAMMELAGGVAIEILVDDRDDRVRAERIQVQQALLNLVRNAVEALAGRPDPRVRIVGFPVSDDRFELRIEDNGRGIAADDMDMIFRPLTTTKTGGMGLGLSVTRTIVESHGGVLKIETSPMGGAAFSFCLTRDPELEDA